MTTMNSRVGAPPEDARVDSAWTDYFISLRNRMVDSWNATRVAYLGLQRVREAFGLPLIVGVSEGADPNALSEAENQVILELAATNDYLTKLMDDVLAGTRRVFYVNAQADTNDFAIEALPTDNTFVNERNGRTVLVDPSGSVIPVSGTLGNPIVWGGIVAGVAVAAMAAYYYTNDSNNQVAKVQLEEKGKQELAKQSAAMVSSGKATPEEAKKIVDAILLGSAELKRAGVQADKEKEGEGIQSTIKTVMWAALGVGVLYALAKVVPPLVASAEQAASRPKLLTNPKWSSKYVNSLPDSAFLVVRKNEVEYVDDKGRSHPLSSRSLPIVNRQGNYSCPHVANAKARLNQVQGITQTEARSIRKKLDRISASACGVG